MIFSLDVRRARKGDCLLLHFGIEGRARAGDDRRRAEGRLQAASQAAHRADPRRRAGLTENESLHRRPADGEPRRRRSYPGHPRSDEGRDSTRRAHGRPRLLNVLGLWHNSFDEIIEHKPTELTASVKSHFGAAAVSGGGDLPEDKKDRGGGEIRRGQGGGRERTEGSCQHRAGFSAAPGRRLASDSQRNPEFDGKLIIAREGGKPVEVGEGLKFMVVGPMQAGGGGARKSTSGMAEGPAGRRENRRPRRSPPTSTNPSRTCPASSSSLRLEASACCSPATPAATRFSKGLQFVGLFEPGESSKIHVDLLKVPHHGSANNLDEDFFERITADHYVFSGNGEHGNPGARRHGDAVQGAWQGSLTRSI